MFGNDILTAGWWLFGIMVTLFIVLTFVRKVPIGISLMFSGMVGTVVGGFGLPVRHLVEGAFTYLDPMLIIFTAMLFMKVNEENGSLGSLARLIIARLGSRPVLLLTVVALFIMFPAMLTGISTTSVLTTGALIAAPLIALGIPPLSVGALIALVSVMGMIAPPINLLAMLIGQGVDMPFIGFEGILASIAFPLALVITFGLAYRHLRAGNLNVALEKLPQSEVSGVKLYLPLILVFFLMGLIRLLPKYIPDIGIPLIFLIGAIAGLFVGKKIRLFPTTYQALIVSLPVLGLLAGIGIFLQVMTLTGVRGLLVVTVLSMPLALTYIGMLISLPVFGGVSAFASAVVFGIPFLLSLLGRNEIIVCAGISLLAGLGDVLLPSAIVARFAAQIVGERSYLSVIRKTIPYVLVSAGVALAVIYYANHLTFLIPKVR